MLQMSTPQPIDIPTLRAIAMAAKGSWGYPDHLMALFAQSLILTPESLARDVVAMACVDATPVGWYRLLPGSPTAILDDLWVLPAHMGHGIGRALFQHMLIQARIGGAKAVELNADPHALPFYQRMGCSVIGESLSEWGRMIPHMHHDLAGALVVAVCSSPTHTFSKPIQPQIELLAGRGVAGDAHQGTLVRHRSRVARDPTQPNLRQVHLIHAELHAELRRAGFVVEPGAMGENITTHGLDLLALPQGSRLQIGPTAVVEITGLRNPCAQLDSLRPGLMAAVLDRDSAGNLVRKAGVMAIVLAGGNVTPGDVIVATLPEAPQHALQVV